MHINNKQINRAIDFILQNLGNEIGVDDVAQHCNLSKYHFNRLFKATTGESVYSFIQKLKMEESAFYIGIDNRKSITDIGLDYGYSSSNYSSAFSKHLKLSPLQFRRLKLQNSFDIKSPFDNSLIEYHDFSYYDDKIMIKEIDDFRVVFERHIGSYRDMHQLWPSFIKRYARLGQPDSQFSEISYNDPNLRDKERCIFDLCMSVTEDCDIDKENIKTIQGGRFASYAFRGKKSQINQAYKGLFNIWLTQTVHQVDHRIGFVIYHSVDEGSGYIEMEINLPIKLSK